MPPTSVWAAGTFLAAASALAFASASTFGSAGRCSLGRGVLGPRAVPGGVLGAGAVAPGLVPGGVVAAGGAAAGAPGGGAAFTDWAGAGGADTRATGAAVSLSSATWMRERATGRERTKSSEGTTVA